MMVITIVTDDNRFFEYVESAVKINGCSFIKYRNTEPEKSVRNTSLLVVDLLSSDTQIPIISGYPVIVLSAVPSFGEAIRFLHKGVKGYGNRYMQPENMLRMFRTVLDGQIWIPPAILTRLIASIPKPDDTLIKAESFDELSEREQQVAELIGHGMNNKEISERMDITLRTVKAHVSSIFTKTGCRDRLEVALKVKSVNKY